MPAALHALRAKPLLCLFSVLSGCSGAPAVRASAPRAEATPPSDPSPNSEPTSEADASAELLVGSVRGLEAWRLDGRSTRLVSKGPAREPRLLDSDSVLALSGKDSSVPISVDVIALETGARRTIATLPPFTCQEGNTPHPGPPLAIQSSSDVVVDSSGRSACITFLDRNLNMADVWLDVRVDLASGAVTRWFRANHRCPAPPGVLLGAVPESARCAGSRTSDPRAGYPFDFANERLIGGDPAAEVAALPGYSVETTSPSGRWLVLGGDREDADYLYRSLVLLDRASGRLYPAPAAAGPFPRALEPGSGAPPRHATPVAGAFRAVGESTVRFIEPTPGNERLVTGELVVIPGERAYSVNGEVAF